MKFMILIPVLFFTSHSLANSEQEAASKAMEAFIATTEPGKQMKKTAESYLNSIFTKDQQLLGYRAMTIADMAIKGQIFIQLKFDF